MTGRLELKTGDGSIRATDIAASVTLHTGDGSVHVDDGQGQIDVDTGDGSVEVSGKLTAVKLHTGDGSIVFRGDSRLVMSDDWDISTGDGSVTIYLPPDFGAELDARTERRRHPQRAPGRFTGGSGGRRQRQAARPR